MLDIGKDSGQRLTDRSADWIPMLSGRIGFVIAESTQAASGRLRYNSLVNAQNERMRKLHFQELRKVLAEGV